MGFRVRGVELEMVDISQDPRDIPDRYRSARNRLIVVDYDGVLVPDPQRPGITVPTRETKAVVHQLSGDPRNTFMLMSGRDKPHLELHWSLLNVVLVAEYGAQFRDRGMSWHSLFDIDNSWMERVSAAMQTLPFQYEGTFLERKTNSIAWHFLNGEGAKATDDIPQIMDAIRTLPRHKEFDVYRVNDRVELAPRGVDPGSFLARWIGSRKFDLVIAVGGARVEESLFTILTRDAITIAVAPPATSNARYMLRSQADVVPFLRSLAGRT
jgi:trehalose 6-phosphate synthase/phosphatase